MHNIKGLNKTTPKIYICWCQILISIRQNWEVTNRTGPKIFEYGVIIFKHQVVIFKYQVKNFKYQVIISEYRDKNFEYQFVIFEYCVKHFEYQVVIFEYQVKSIEYQVDPSLLDIFHSILKITTWYSIIITRNSFFVYDVNNTITIYDYIIMLNMKYHIKSSIVLMRIDEHNLSRRIHALVPSKYWRLCFLIVAGLVKFSNPNPSPWYVCNYP